MAVQSTMVALGERAPEFALTSLDGDRVTLSDYAEAPGLLVLFLSNHCPYVRHVERKLAEVLDGFADLAVVGVMSNDTAQYPDDAPDRLRDQVERAGWTFPYLLDEDQQVAQAYRAACTPDFFLYDADRRLVYRGAFDESTPGNRKPLTGELLATAIRRLLDGEPVPEPQRPSMGCSIKWKPGVAP